MTERVPHPVFTEEMRQTHTILFPDMVDNHFHLLENVLRQSGYRAALLTNEGPEVSRTGQKYVHNDTCYPALLTIGQMISALESGGYDPDHTALILPQTGGGCRASNYVSLLCKALRDAGMGQVPVISLNLQGLDDAPGFRITLPFLRKMLACMAYGDLLMILANQVRPYEVEPGQTDALVNAWIKYLSKQFSQGSGYDLRSMKQNDARIARTFHEIPVHRVPKVKTGIVGEIYVKYSALANNHLEEFLRKQDCEVMMPGIMQFLLYAADMPLEDVRLYGGKKSTQVLNGVMLTYLTKYESLVMDAIGQYPEFTVPARYRRLKELAAPLIGTGCKMGEGWLLTAEMAELALSGYSNIVCAQPFGCLPNHIAGKAMISKVRRLYPEANIVAIDYDPGAARVNQENRIKLMLSIARENLEKETNEQKRS